MARRNDLDICANILQVSRVVRKTRIVYQANLNFKIVGKYLSRLLDGELLRKADDENFFTTRKGIQFLQQYKTLVEPIAKTESFPRL